MESFAEEPSEDEEFVGVLEPVVLVLVLVLVVDIVEFEVAEVEDVEEPLEVAVPVPDDWALEVVEGIAPFGGGGVTARSGVDGRSASSTSLSFSAAMADATSDSFSLYNKDCAVTGLGADGEGATFGGLLGFEELGTRREAAAGLRRLGVGELGGCIGVIILC